jgi:hypothetical protein
MSERTLEMLTVLSFNIRNMDTKTYNEYIEHLEQFYKDTTIAKSFAYEM